MALARGMAPGGGGAGGMGGAGMAAGIAMAGAALYSATQGDISKPRTSKPDANFERKNKKKCWNFLMFCGVVVFTCWLCIQCWIQSQYGMFEFIGIDASPEEYKRRIISFYEEHNPEQLVGDKHRRPVDSLFWKHRYKERKLWEKIQKKYKNKPKKTEIKEQEKINNVEEETTSSSSDHTHHTTDQPESSGAQSKKDL